ncbi:DUF58 domain-containing protein [Gramella sp. MAR_2010_147]|uniref:DUF58 domain-containing protein n=1 Tax=Gramella sp. MAR_2010_147 TaxID=1250205 RepID=UPI000879270F|nr:DUF58 domain-containing protein [Gramella sp. MAR_2010_147]SDR89204.1 Uncharacterized conserved protein, DUF58 family, contains vWF domain [Gramella sp. MAR_2010_147]
MLKFIRSLYFGKRLFYALFGISLLFLISFWFEPLYSITWIITSVLGVLVFTDVVTLYSRSLISADRILPEKFSNSDENIVEISILNKHVFKVYAEIIDEIPVQFQKRDFLKSLKLPAHKKNRFNYLLKPLKRGEYIFGNLNIYISTFLKLAKRRYIFNKDQMVKVYPSFIQMKKLDFMALDQKIDLHGIKRIRRIGHTMEFEQIKEYVRGDDVRTINWKATAKNNHLMVNQFQDERSQPVYSIIDCGRMMKMPFEGLSLLDYAINSSLAFSNVALKKKDKVGMLSFSNKIDNLQKASSKLSQLNRLMEALYNVNTGFFDSDFSLLYSRLKKQITHRSLLMLYTNFEHMSALQRQLPYLKAIAKNHLLVVIFFENTEMTKLTHLTPVNVSESAHQTIAEQFVHNKLLMSKELQRHGIQTLLTPPKDLSINAINKYLEIKARGLL